MVGFKHLHLHWSVAGQISQGAVTPGSCQQVPLGNSNGVRVGVCRQDGSLGGGTIPGWLFLQSLFLRAPPPRSSIGQEHFWVKKFWDECVAPSLFQGLCLSIGSGLYRFYLPLSAKIIPIVSWEPRFPGIWVWDPPVAIPIFSSPPPTTYFYLVSWPSVPLFCPLQYRILPPLFPPPSLPIILFPPQYKTEVSTS
jgi:hypothetical protein